MLYGGWLPGTDIPLSQPSPTLDLTPGITGRMLYLVGEDDAAQRDQIRTALGPPAPTTSWSATQGSGTRSAVPARRRILALLAS